MKEHAGGIKKVPKRLANRSVLLRIDMLLSTYAQHDAGQGLVISNNYLCPIGSSISVMLWTKEGGPENVRTESANGGSL